MTMTLTITAPDADKAVECAKATFPNSELVSVFKKGKHFQVKLKSADPS